jgi:hypothetical protein
MSNRKGLYWGGNTNAMIWFKKPQIILIFIVGI